MPRLEFFQDINAFIFLLRSTYSYVYGQFSAETVGLGVGLLVSRSSPILLTVISFLSPVSSSLHEQPSPNPSVLGGDSITGRMLSTVLGTHVLATVTIKVIFETSLQRACASVRSDMEV